MPLSICIEASQFTKEYTNLRQLTDALYMVARHACDVKVAEIVVLGEGEESLRVAALLQYFVTPRYLVRETFQAAWKRGLDKNVFAEAHKCPPMRSLKCLRPWKRDEGSGYYREAVAVTRSVRRGKTASGKVARVRVQDRTTEWVNAGLGRSVKLSERVPFGVRVTVEVDVEVKEDVPTARLVSSKTAWGYCGYVVRGAADAGAVFAGAGAVAGDAGYARVVGAAMGDSGNSGYSGDNGTTTLDNTTPTTTDTAVLVAVNTLRELWDDSVRVPSFLVADACAAALALVATAGPTSV